MEYKDIPFICHCCFVSQMSCLVQEHCIHAWTHYSSLWHSSDYSKNTWEINFTSSCLRVILMASFAFFVHGHRWRWYWGRGGPWTGCAGGWGWVEPPLTPAPSSLQSAQQPLVPTEQTGTGAGTKQTRNSTPFWCRIWCQRYYQPHQAKERLGYQAAIRFYAKTDSSTFWKTLILL